MLAVAIMNTSNGSGGNSMRNRMGAFRVQVQHGGENLPKAIAQGHRREAHVLHVSERAMLHVQRNGLPRGPVQQADPVQTDRVGVAELLQAVGLTPQQRASLRIPQVALEDVECGVLLYT